jgi:hypothetical protein
MKAKAAMSTAPPTPPQPIPPKAPLMLRVRDDLLVAVIIILAITSAICTGVIATVMVIDRVARPAAVVSETPKKPDVPVPAKPVTPEKPVTPINPEPPIVTPTPSPEKPAAPATPLGSAVRDYREGLATEFADLAVQVRSGALKTGADVAAAARTYAAPMATAKGTGIRTVPGMPPRGRLGHHEGRGRREHGGWRQPY